MAISISYTGIDLLAFQFLLASLGCVAAGLGVWTVTALCRRWLPGIAAQRTVWLLAQCSIVAAFVLVLMPHSERLHLLPPIDIETFSAAPAVAAAGAPAAAAGPRQADAAAAADRTPHRYLAYAAQAWLGIYAAGLVYALRQLRHSRRVLQALARAGERTATEPVDTIEIDAPISPMLFGLLRPRLLLPRHLHHFAEDQRQLIVAHELTHWRRRDLHWNGAGIVLQTVFWFNPFMRLLRRQLSWAQELGCDRDVLQGRPPAQRKAYAAALVAQLKLHQASMPTALAFGNVTPDSVASRIALIRTPSRHGRWTRIATVAGLAAVLAASLTLQPSLASPGSRQLSCIALMDAATGQRLRYDGQCDERATPASTFNIVVALMGYDSGILIDEHTPRLPYKPGYISWNKEWQTDTDPSSWIINSTVWYAQQITTQLGKQRFQHYIDRFGYGNRDVSGDAGKDNGLTQSWIGSSLQVSPGEQLDFLRKIVTRQLPVSAQAYDMTARILNPQTLANGWTIYGKTGTASPTQADGRDDPSRQYGWYVGWATKGTRTIVFTHMALDQRQQTFAGFRARQAFLRNVATQLDTL
jgi:beta-lactamase class D/beta-lactamase regulating signal transducer with metallopeptidase domain